MNKNKFLLVIDVQQGFIGPHTAHLVPKIVELAATGWFGQVVCTQFKNREGSPWDIILGWPKLRTAQEQEIPAELLKYADVVLPKQVYSAVDERLLRLIKKGDYGEVTIVGFDTDCCVQLTAVGLFEHGIRPIVRVDYCASNGGPESHQAGLVTMRRTIGKGQLV